MAANDVQLSRIPIQNGEITIQNTDGANDFTPGMVLTFDATNGIPSAANPVIGCKQATTDDYAFGIALEAIAHNTFSANKGSIGRAIFLGTAIMRMVGSAANAGVIGAGTIVQADSGGQVKVAAAGKPQLGQALTAAAAQGDQILVAVSVAKNA